MALKQLEIQDQLNHINQNLTVYNNELNSLKTRSLEIKEAFKIASNDNNAEKMQELLEEDDQLEIKSNKLRNEIERNNKLVSLLEKSLDKTQKGENAKMKLKNNRNLEQREAVNEYLRTKDITRADGFTTSKGEVLMPIEIIYEPRDEVYQIQKLIDYVNVVPVTTKSGEYPILSHQEAVLHTVEELKENPQLAEPQFIGVDFKVRTYRGQEEISQEAIDDAAVDLIPILEKDISQQKINTDNVIILEQMRNFKFKDFSSLDDLKTIINVDLDPDYNLSWFLSQTLFNAIDQLKDEDGRYYLQPDPTNGTRKYLFGYPVIIIKDNKIGKKKGDAVGFIGDLKAGVTYFDRKKITVQWIDHPVYGQALMTGMRCDCQMVDYNAGFYLTYKAPTKTQLASNIKGLIKISNE